MVTTPTRIFQFVGGPSFEKLFAAFKVCPIGRRGSREGLTRLCVQDATPSFHELPGSESLSHLQFHHKHGMVPSFFAWLTAPGVYYGALVFGSQSPVRRPATCTRHRCTVAVVRVTRS